MMHSGIVVLSVVLSSLLAVLLSACGAAPVRHSPLQNSAAAQVLLPSAEITGVLEVDNNGQRSSYLLALRSAAGELDLALLTPQGGPLYELGYHQSELSVARKLARGDEPQGRELLLVLQLIYGAEQPLRSVLAPGWKIQQEGARRAFAHAESGREIFINYAGDPPWYSRTQLIDSLHDTILTVRIQERRDVLPE
jgi:hypothetical protein